MPYPDYIINLTTLISAIFLALFGVYYTNKRKLSVCFLVCGVIFGLTTVFFYWCNDALKRQTAKAEIKSHSKDNAKSFYVNRSSHQSPLISRNAPRIHSLKDAKFKVNTSHLPKTAYSHLTNEELTRTVFNLIPKMRSYVQQKNSIDLNRNEYFSLQMKQAKTQEERHRIWQTQAREQATSTPLDFEYGSLFKAEVTLLHDELLKRLPNAPNDKYLQSDYERPTNPIGLNHVINDLERLAKSLPK